MIVTKALTQKGRGIAEIATAYNVGYSTLQKWLRNHRHTQGNATNTAKPRAMQLTTADRFNHLLATSNLDEIGVGAYCREHGLYSFQLQEWKNEFMTQEKDPKKQDYSELKTLRSENKLLKQELRRKEKALAETAALLVLKKKADLIWGDSEDA